ncbi:hypothetical protein [Roseateles sp. PN1]|uniref:hypothetical protein n=1 Tax=Roseateles sp. PN1 TaxID=3137372 RepID=UPI00313875EE
MPRREHRPQGHAPTVLEANVLKLRAFEIVLVLFYMEDLKRFILRSIKVSDMLTGYGDRLSDGKVKTKEGKKLELAREVLVAEGVIDQAESDEIKDLVDYRNTIGHQIHKMTVDVGAYSELVRFDGELGPVKGYDHKAAKRAAELRDKVKNGMMSKFVMELSFDSLAFEAAERTYLLEIRRLNAKVDKGIAQLNQLIEETNQSIRAIPKAVMESAQPLHPKHQKANGNLTDSGKSCIFQLFNAKATPYAAAHLMKISLRASTLWFKRWQASR